ncbi:Inherit from bactNOG: SnoaL-like polyketide cyclase [Seminavis robusta]|uniref:Inherit from bactNOG: SnoaL-like polyketide cyclase n=1 Tax=Seminavis robusta TaxID=568900 RepID=A0A9N8H7H6_9STRA|nr:Inherit from bactNOG: SnoaL-like polyketide cyclase [Seminavis robusta]|eukprot:Sro204_g086020.1 Inherit from bactNOG: SnoaL-like polyketide cyclase (255) ;mRNA; f:82578-83342
MSTSTTNRKDLVRKLLKGIETGDPESAAVVNEEKYIQHNPQTREGGEGLAQLFKRISKSNPKVNLVRAFQDGDFVFGHTEYDFSTRRIGFEVFRFEGNQAVEHWDNIQPRQPKNELGLEMVDGPKQACDLDKTEANRKFVRDFAQIVFVDGNLDKIGDFVSSDSFTQYSPYIPAVGGSEGITQWLDGGKVKYTRIHRVLTEGSFCLVVSEGTLNDVHTSFYDLYRVSEGKITEHWDTIESVPPKSEWKNNNGKF